MQHEGVRLEDVRTASHTRYVHSCLTKILHLCLVSPGIRQGIAKQINFKRKPRKLCCFDSRKTSF